MSKSGGPDERSEGENYTCIQGGNSSDRDWMNGENLSWAVTKHPGSFTKLSSNKVKFPKKLSHRDCPQQEIDSIGGLCKNWQWLLFKFSWVITFGRANNEDFSLLKGWKECGFLTLLGGFFGVQNVEVWQTSSVPVFLVTCNQPKYPERIILSFISFRKEDLAVTLLWVDVLGFNNTINTFWIELMCCSYFAWMLLIAV